MKRSAWLLCVPVLWLATAPLPAQDQTNAPLYEELEILRHLLRTKISEGYTQASQAAGQANANVYLDFGMPNVNANTFSSYYNARLNPATTANTTQNPNAALIWYLGGQPQQPYVTIAHAPDLRTEGAYLRGQGMVFTITMPPWPQLHHLMIKPALQKPSDWEQARQQVRGEAGWVVDFHLQVQTGPDLKEVLLRTLAENGKHLKHLKDTESVTVVVVFRGQGTSAATSAVSKETVNAVKPEKPAVKPPPTQAPSDKQTLLESYARLYELQAKQGRLDEARKAIDQLLKLLDEESGDGSQKTRREFLRRALQFYLTLENPTPDEVTRIRKITDELTQKPQPKVNHIELSLTEGSPAPRLPSRLIITVPKKVLIQAGSGKLDLAAFEKQVQIEEVNWTK